MDLWFWENPKTKNYVVSSKIQSAPPVLGQLNIRPLRMWHKDSSGDFTRLELLIQSSHNRGEHPRQTMGCRSISVYVADLFTYIVLIVYVLDCISIYNYSSNEITYHLCGIVCEMIYDALWWPSSSTTHKTTHHQGLWKLETCTGDRHEILQNNV